METNLSRQISEMDKAYQIEREVAILDSRRQKLDTKREKIGFQLSDLENELESGKLSDDDRARIQDNIKKTKSEQDQVVEEFNQVRKELTTLRSTKPKTVDDLCQSRNREIF